MEDVSEQGTRRYPRTFRGLIASMIVLVIAVVAFWALTSGWGDALREERTKGIPQGADWKSAVAAMQSAAGDEGVPTVVYPGSLPSGWYANTDPRFQPGRKPSWQMGFVQGETGYVGIMQAKGSDYDLARDVVDSAARRGDTVTVETEVADRWTSWSDAGGDAAFTARVDGLTLIVWGPGEQDVRTFLGLLTTEPLRS